MKRKINLIAKLCVVVFCITYQNCVRAEDSGVILHGFADMIGGSSSADAPETQRLRGFSMGNVDLFLNPEFGQKVKALFEIVFEPTTDDGSTSLDLERTQLGYSLNDENIFWVGRFHTPYGAWNTAYHHGAQLMTPIYRPRFIDFEDKGGLMPAHSVGSWIHGSTKLVDGKIIYDFYSVNGSRIITNGTSGTLDYNLSKADRQGAMNGFNISYKFGCGNFEGVQIGIHGYTGAVNSYSSKSYGSGSYMNSTDVQMTGGYVFYEGEKFELDGEYYKFDNKDKTSAASNSETLTSSLYFVEVGVPFEKWKPFVSYEMAVLNSADKYFSQQVNAMSYVRSTWGIHYDLDSVSALKFQMLSTKATTPTELSYTTWATQYAIRF